MDSLIGGIYDTFLSRGIRCHPLAELFLQNFWLRLAVWSALYVSDYSMTIKCARLYQESVRDKIVFEGSYELTPYFQSDIDALRRVSLKFILALLWTSILLFLVWRLIGNPCPQCTPSCWEP